MTNCYRQQPKKKHQAVTEKKRQTLRRYACLPTARGDGTQCEKAPLVVSQKVHYRIGRSLISLDFYGSVDFRRHIDGEQQPRCALVLQETSEPISGTLRLEKIQVGKYRDERTLL